RPVAEVVKNSSPSTKHGLPIRRLADLVSNPESRRHIAISGLIEGCAAWREGNCRGSFQARYRKGLVRRALSLERRIQIPPQAIGQRDPISNLPRILPV